MATAPAQRLPRHALALPERVRELFPPERGAALGRIANLDPPAYARTRNHLRGAVSRLSPYFTHGLVSVPEVIDALPPDAGKLLQELAWREYFQLVHALEGRAIFIDRFGPQPRRAPDAGPLRFPRSLLEGATGIAALDDAVAELVSGGYLHNRQRLWLASVACHVAGADWRAGASWFFHHLLDGDLASNTLSWQWVAGSGAAKPYLADQTNLNRFSDTHQSGTFLDRAHASLLSDPVPETLRESVPLDLRVTLPDLPVPRFDPGRPLLVYHPWALDPTWRADDEAERWLLLEPSLFERHPWSPLRLAWVLAAANGVPGLQIAVADAPALLRARAADAAAGRAASLRHRAHPAVAHWPGPSDPAATAFAQRWTSASAPRSFSAFWKQVAPQAG